MIIIITLTTPDNRFVQAAPLGWPTAEAPSGSEPRARCASLLDLLREARPELERQLVRRPRCRAARLACPPCTPSGCRARSGGGREAPDPQLPHQSADSSQHSQSAWAASSALQPRAAGLSAALPSAKRRRVRLAIRPPGAGVPHSAARPSPLPEATAPELEDLPPDPVADPPPAAAAAAPLLSLLLPSPLAPVAEGSADQSAAPPASALSPAAPAFRFGGFDAAPSAPSPSAAPPAGGLLEAALAEQQGLQARREGFVLGWELRAHNTVSLILAPAPPLPRRRSHHGDVAPFRWEPCPRPEL